MKRRRSSTFFSAAGWQVHTSVAIKTGPSDGRAAGKARVVTSNGFGCADPPAALARGARSFATRARAALERVKGIEPSS